MTINDKMNPYPCRNCQTRVPGCHASCRDYLSAKAAHLQISTAIADGNKGNREAYQARQLSRVRYLRENLRRHKQGRKR